MSLRRAISASYYGLFHTFLRAAADELIGATRAARMSAEDAAKPQLPRRYVEVLRKARFDRDIQIAASNFVHLQKSRHVADYDPQFRFKKSDALAAIEQAVTGCVMSATADESERRNFLLCMLVPPR